MFWVLKRTARDSSFENQQHVFWLRNKKINFSYTLLTQALYITMKIQSRNVCITQGCGNTMPDLSNLVPLHSGQVENFYLLVLGHVQMY